MVHVICFQSLYIIISGCTLKLDVFRTEHWDLWPEGYQELR